MIEIKEDGYYLAMWFLPGVSQDFLAFAYREGDRWVCKSRFRYYLDKKTFESSDEKSWYKAEASIEKHTEDGFIVVFDVLVNELVSRGYLRKDGQVWRREIRGDGKKVLELLKEAPFANIRKEKLK